jgi:hypothetical protein
MEQGEIYTNFSEKGIEFFIFTIPISLHGNDFLIKESFYKSLKFMEFLKYLKPKLDKIYPSKFPEINNKAHVTIITSS